MRSGRFASSRAMTRIDRSGALPRTLYALVSFGAAVMTVDSGQAESLTATFQQEQYANPQPDLPICAVTWPGLVAANNEAHAKGFLHNGPAIDAIGHHAAAAQAANWLDKLLGELGA